MSAAAAVDHMTREEAFAAMDGVQPLRPIMRDAVYNYWAEKRKRAGRPFIRRLWAPTSASDQNPFGVFRCDLPAAAAAAYGASCSLEKHLQGPCVCRCILVYFRRIARVYASVSAYSWCISSYFQLHVPVQYLCDMRMCQLFRSMPGVLSMFYPPFACRLHSPLYAWGTISSVFLMYYRCIARVFLYLQCISHATWPWASER